MNAARELNTRCGPLQTRPAQRACPDAGRAQRPALACRGRAERQPSSVIAGRAETDRRQTPPAPANFRDWKHSLQKTGRPCVGLKGTVVSLPHAEHVVAVSTRSLATAPPAGRLARLALQALHRFGSFLKFLSAKNCCSPAVQMNSVLQSTHERIRSWNSIGRYLVVGGRSIPIRAGASCDSFSGRA